MIRRWFNASEKTNVRTKAKSGQNKFGQFEQLEDKRCLAWTGFFDGITLTLNQTVDDGDVIIDNSGVGGAFRVTDNASSLTFVDAENIEVNMLSNTANQLNFQINTSHSGDVELNLGDGPRDIIFDGFNFPGVGNTVGGDMTVNSGTGPQFINLAPIVGLPLPYQSNGSSTFNLGDGFDTVYNNENFVVVGGDLNLLGVNRFQYTDFLFPVPLDADLRVGGNMTMDTSMESTESFLIEGGTFHSVDIEDPLIDQERSIIEGDFTYIGGDDIDHVDLNSTYIIGDITIDLGEGIPFFGDPQNVTTTLELPWVLDGPYFQTDGDISISAGDSKLGNVITLNGYSTKSSGIAEFNMGGLTDEITYGLNNSFFPFAQNYNVIASMGSGADTFTLTTNLNTLAIDFGNDLGDTFVNQWGFFGFDADYTNYHNFDFFFTAGDNTMIANQLLDTGDVTIDNNAGPATGIDWQFFTAAGGIAPLNHSETLIVNMVSDTGNRVSMDLDNPVIAFITLNLNDGDRVVDFIGDSNNPLRDVNINANLGDQFVQLSDTAELAAASLRVNLGEGFDTVDDNFNNLMLSEDLVFSGVNLFEHDGSVSIGRNVFVDTLTEVAENVWASNDSLFVGGSFNYTGGDGRDELRLNGTGGTSITQFVDVKLGDNLVGGTQSVLLDGAVTFLGGTLRVESTAATTLDVFATATTGSFSGNILVDLGDGENNADIVGFFGGTEITYSGGDQVDTVTFGTTGNAARFTATLFDGDDVFTLLSGASIASPFIVNFGDNNDVFINNYGPFDFDAELIGLAGFNHFFDLTNSSLISTQVSDRGPVVVDNNGTGDAIRFTTTSTSQIATVTALEINMLGGSSSSLEVDFDNLFNGDLELNLRSGPRTVSFTGDVNNIAGMLDVSGGSGEQTFSVAVNAPLFVANDMLVDLGNDADTISDDGNTVTVGGNMEMTGVNDFTVNSGLTVGQVLFIDNAGDNVASQFSSPNSLNVGGALIYFGNSQNDVVDLPETATTSIGGDVRLALEGGANIGNLNGSIGGSEVLLRSDSGDDMFNYSMIGSPVGIDAVLGAGDDEFTLGAGVSVSSMLINFGNNDDTFINNYGTFDFPVQLLGLNGFDHFFSVAGASLQTQQISATGAVTVDTNGAGGAVRVIAGGDTTVLGPVDNINFSMLNGFVGDDLTIDLDSPLAGDLTINLNDGFRTLNFLGDSNSIGGSLAISGGVSSQTVNLGLGGPLMVGVDATINLDGDIDFVSPNGNDVTVMGNMTMVGVNDFQNDGNFVVDGDVLVDNLASFAPSSFIDNAMMDIQGEFTYRGGDANDFVQFNSSSSVGGNIDINAGQGDNTATILGGLGPAGTDIKYTGGDGVDRVTVGTTGSPAAVNAKLRAGDDVFTLNAGAAIATDSLRVDFGGGGDDTFTSNYGAFDFNARLLDLDGYNAFFDLPTGNLDIQQVADTGNVTIDSNGLGNAVRFGVGTMNELTPANDLRLILESNTSTNVIADFDAERNGNTVIQLRDGDRTVNFTGTSNTFNGLLRIEAADGVQTVFAAESAPLNVDGTFIFNARDASDRLVAENAINVTGAMLLRNINTFVNDAGLSVDSDFNMITVLENEATKLISNNSFAVGGNFTYMGADGVDAINFKSDGATIDGYTYIDIATSSDALNNQRVQLTGGYSTSNLVVVGGNAVAGNFFSTDAATTVVDDVIVNFASSTNSNTVVFLGTYFGDYGTYRGGSGSDFVTYGATADLQLFAALMGAGDDTFTIAPTAMLDFLYVDFGTGNDTLENQLGEPLPFDNNIFNL